MNYEEIMKDKVLRAKYEKVCDWCTYEYNLLQGDHGFKDKSFCSIDHLIKYIEEYDLHPTWTFGFEMM